MTPGTYAKGEEIADTNLRCNESDVTVASDGTNNFLSADCLLQRGYTVKSLNSIKYDNFVMEFSFRISDSNCQFQCVLRSGSGGKYDLKPFSITSGGKIKYLSDESEETVDYNQWYNVAVLCKANPDSGGTYSKTFAVFMKEDGRYVLKSQQTDSISDSSKNSVSRAGLWVDKVKNSTGKVDFDNIRVYTEKYVYGAKFLLQGDSEILAAEVGLETDAYIVNNTEMTIEAPRGLSSEYFIDSIKEGLTGKVVSITDSEGNVSDTVKNGGKFKISSYDEQNILEYTFIVKNLAPSVEITSDGKKDIADFKVSISASDDEAVEKIEMFLNGKYSGDAAVISDGRYEYLFEDASYIGNYEVKAVAYDYEGKSSIDTKSFLVTATKVNRTAKVDFDDSESSFYQSNGFGTGANENTSNEIKSLDSSHGKSYIATVAQDSGKSTSGPWVALNGSSAKKIRIAYDMYLSAEGLSTCVFIRDRSASTEVVNQMPQVINGSLVYYDGSTEKTITLESKKWYTITSFINTVDDTYSFELSNDDGIIFYGESLALQKVINVVTDMRICFGGGADGKIALDNVYVDVFDEMPYIDGASDDGEVIKEYIDYTSKSVYLKIPSGFELPADASVVKLFSPDGEVKIKDVSKSSDGTFLKITPDYLESQGFEPNTVYDVVISEDLICEGTEEKLGYEIKDSFITTMRDFEVVKTSFSKMSGVSFEVDFKNDSSDDAYVLLILTAFENGVFVDSVFESVTVNPGESTHNASIPVTKTGTVVKARIVNTNGLTFTNRIYEYIIK